MIRDFMRGTALASALIALPFLCSSASAQLAVSANDNKIALVNGVNIVPANSTPDTVTILISDFCRKALRWLRTSPSRW
jgi:hypothetical protein